MHAYTIIKEQLKNKRMNERTNHSRNQLMIAAEQINVQK